MTIDRARRKTVMGRSMKLGHCVCDPKKPCPCDVFRQHNVCQCAGERLPVKPGRVALTKLVHKAGCASKIGQADLLRIIANLPAVDDPNVLVGAAAGDDAGIYRLPNGHALVQTVDVFTPCVDDPYTFGQIAAANSVSDVYAMGGAPITALSIIGFPIDELDGAVMEAILRGGMDKLAEAECALIGGHSINDPDIKCGFAVTGLIGADNAVQRDKARPGDALVLTKPLGTGIIAFAAQIGRVGETALAAAAAQMATLNKDAAELMCKYSAHACTDVTGYGLAGHLAEMARGSGVVAEINLARLPVFAAVPGLIDQDVLPGAVERNADYAGAWVRPAQECAAHAAILYDPQTSGGLLVSLPKDAAADFAAELKARGHAAAVVIGSVKKVPKNGRPLVNVTGKLTNLFGESEVSMPNQPKLPPPAPEPAAPELEECCPGGPPLGDESPAGAAQSLAMFSEFMKAANAPGLIESRAKKLMAVVLSISHHCEPCLKIHIKSALAMGVSFDELDEAANLAVAFGGCTAMMFYNEVSAPFRRGAQT